MERRDEEILFWGRDEKGGYLLLTDRGGLGMGKWGECIDH